MSCSARFDTRSTYRNLLSTPSGKPSIAFLLEPLGHPRDGFERRLRLQLLGYDRGLEALSGLGQVVIDDDVLVELFAGVDLVDGLLQPRFDLRLRVQPAVPQALFQCLEGGWEDEYIQRALFELGIERDLPRSLVVDVEDDVFAAIEAADDLRLRRSVLLLVNVSMFEKFPLPDHGFEGDRRDIVIIHAVALAVSRAPSGVRDGKVELDPDRLELLAHAFDERSLSRTGRAGDDEQRPVRVEVTRHSVPARGCARPRFSI